MTVSKHHAPRPMRIVVAPGSKAEAFCRNYRTGVHPGPVPVPHEEAIAPGFQRRPGLDMNDFGGHVIRDLVYTNFFVVGAASWAASDISDIDKHLAAAMSDVKLNNVLVQYYRGATSISTTFRPSSVLPGAPPASISQPEVEQLVSDLHAAGKLAGFDFASTVFNFMLPRGVELTIDDGGGARTTPTAAKGPAKPPHEVEEKVSSKEGLGGFHGSVKFGAQRVYYAVGVFSEGDNGIVAFNKPWKNVVATFYHELVEARTDADVEENRVAWVNARGEEIGDIPMSLAGGNHLSKVMKEVPLADGSGTVPIQLMWSNAVHGPEGPIATAHPGH